MKAILNGTLGKDCEVRTSANGNGFNICFSVAENTREKIGEEWQEVTTWYNCLYYTSREKVAEYLRKGTRVLLFGTFTVDTFISEKTGKINVSRELFVSDLQILSFPKERVDEETGEVLPPPSDPIFPKEVAKKKKSDDDDLPC